MESRPSKSSFHDATTVVTKRSSPRPPGEKIRTRRLHLDVRVRRPHQPCLDGEACRGDIAGKPLEVEEVELHVDGHPEHLLGVDRGLSILPEVDRDEEQSAVHECAVKLAQRRADLCVAGEVNDRIEGDQPMPPAVAGVEARHGADLERQVRIQRPRPLHHQRRQIDPRDRKPQAGEESADVARTASGVANERPGAEGRLDLLGERRQQRSVEGLVLQFVADALDVGVGDRVVARAYACLVIRGSVAACYLRGVMRPWTARALAAGVDLVCLALFVVLGRASHDISSGIAWYLTVLWPFLVGWFVVALALRLYRSPLDRWVVLACTWVAGCAIALGLRATVTDRSTPIAFIIVAYIFIGATTFGWRLLVHGLARVRTRRSSSAGIS